MTRTDCTPCGTPFAQIVRRLRRLHRDVHRPAFPDDLVGATLDRVDQGGIEPRTLEVDAAALGAQVKGQRVALGKRQAGRGQQVLAAVLLHVIAPALRIDASVHLVARRGLGDPGGSTAPSSASRTSTTATSSRVPVSCG
jgi:hypothetical protein